MKYVFKNNARFISLATINNEMLLRANAAYMVLCLLLLLLTNTSGASELAVPDHITAPPGTHEGADVEQPIEFPHITHVKENKINCMYCHTYARRSKVAGIPPTSKCMGCHKLIATDKPRIQKLTEYWENKSSPKWKKVTDLPDFVHFSHEKHLSKFVFNADYPVDKVEEVCGLCHGDVGSMTVAKKTKPLNMGFCRRCHQANEGPGDCWKCHK